MWLRGLGCFLYDTPEMVHVRNITKQRVRDGTFIPESFIGIHFHCRCTHCIRLCFQVNYPVEAKKNLANFSVVLDTPEYNRVTELKSHMSNVSRCLNYFIEILTFSFVQLF